MTVLRDFLTREVVAGTTYVLVALLLLFGLFDLIQELGDYGRGGYRLPQILLYLVLELPRHAQVIFPVAALIGTLFALARMVSREEFTVIRTSGLSPVRVYGLLLPVALVFVLSTFALGELVAPKAERLAQRLRLQALNSVVAQQFRSGFWLKDGTSFINVAEVLPDGSLRDVRAYHFDPRMRLDRIWHARRGVYLGERLWRLEAVAETRIEPGRAVARDVPNVRWRSVLTPEILNLLLARPEQMSAWELRGYIHHLRENQQDTLAYEVAYWNKLVYPVAVAVLMLFALPFAYRQARFGNVSARVFLGILLGLGFVLASRVFAHLGILNNWPAVISAFAPTVLFAAAAAAMLTWVNRPTPPALAGLLRARA